MISLINACALLVLKSSNLCTVLLLAKVAPSKLFSKDVFSFDVSSQK